jgi:glycosyltransferase involved in cell wall biosynthesis
LGHANVGVSAFVETDICNPNWIECANKMDHIVVPSQHVKETIERTGTVQKPLSVIPEAFMDAVLAPRTLDITFDTKFNFLIVGQLTGNNLFNDRKNIFNTIKWICEAFKNDPEVGIIVKTNSGTGTTLDRMATTNQLRSIVSNVRKGSGPNVYLIHGNMDESEIAGLYRHESVKALVSLTRGEGYGLPLLEAAASDLPVIATNWSGHLDFLNAGRFIPVNYTLNEIHSSRIDNAIFVKGSKWAEASEDDFKRKIKKFRNSYGIPQEWARSLGEKVRKAYASEAVEKIYSQILGHLL